MLSYPRNPRGEFGDQQAKRHADVGRRSQEAASGASPDARQIFVAWFNEIAKETESPTFDESQAGAWSKLGHAARFALILSRLRSASEMLSIENEVLAAMISEFAPISPVEQVDVEGAIKVANYCKSHILRVAHQMTGGLASPDARRIVNWIKRKNVLTFREADIATDLRGFYHEPQKLADALTYLTERDVIRKIETSDPVRGVGSRLNALKSTRSC